MKKLLLVLMIGMMGVKGYGQITFQKVYGGDSINTPSNDMIQTIDSGFIMIGGSYIENPIGLAALIIKTDKLGEVIWSKKFGVEGYSVVSNYIRQTSDNGFIITGTIDTSGDLSNRIFLIKIDYLGNLIWNKVFHSSIDSFFNNGPLGIRQALDNGFVITGERRTQSGAQRDFLIRTDSMGNLIFSKSYWKQQHRSRGFDLQFLDNGEIILIGVDDPLNPYNNILLIKVNNNGIPIWSRTIGTVATDSMVIPGYPAHLETAPDGGYVFCVPIQDHYTNSYYNHFILTKTDSAGNLMWNYLYNVIQSDEVSGCSIKNTTDGGFILCGDSEDSLEDDDIYLIKTDEFGNLIWNRTYGTLVDHDMIGETAFQTSDNGYAIIGQDWDYSVRNIYLIKTDSIGNSMCNQLDRSVPVTPLTLWDSLITVQVDSFIYSETNLTFITGAIVIDTVNVCSTTGIKESSSNNSETSLYPNPTSGTFTLSIRNLSPALAGSNWDLRIIDVLGQEVYSQPIFNQESTIINLPQLSNGVYFYQLSNSKETFRGKFVKE